MKEILEDINDVHLENLGQKKANSLYINTGEYRILTSRFVELDRNNLEYVSLSYLLNNKGIFKITENQEEENLSDGYKELYLILNSKIRYLSNLISIYVKEIEALEDQIFERKKLNSFLSEWFHHRKGLLKLSRVFDRVTAVFAEFMRAEKEMIGQNSKEYSDLQYDAEVQLRIIKSELEKLDTIYSYYTSIKNDNLNKNLFVLSVISGVFLPLNLIVGFFGMNTTGLFLSDHPAGTSIVFNTIMALFILLLVGPPLLNFVDRIVVSKLFGRYKFYSKLSEKFETLSNDFSILNEK